MKHTKELIRIFLLSLFICICAFYIKENYETYDRVGLIFWSMLMGCDIAIFIFRVLFLLEELDEDSKDDERTNK